MYYPTIELNGYERLALNEITHFSMSMTSALQLIIGTNGCGKSSLMYQLSPLPGDPRDFAKDGSKRIRCVHNHRDYYLQSNFGQKLVHSFVVDGVELNGSGLISLQYALCKEHFGITPEVHRLLLGKDTFDQMSAPKRKEWFLKMCVTNYDYAIRLWNKARELLRDISGAMKLAKKTLVQESEKLIGDEVLAKLKAEADQLHKVLNFLLEYRKPVEGDLDVLDMRQTQLDQRLTSFTSTLQQLHNTLDSHLMSVSEYDPLIAAAQEQITGATAVLDQLSGEHKKNDDKIMLLQRAEAKSVEKLSQEIDTILARQTFLLESSLIRDTHALGLPNAKSALVAFESLRHALADIFNDIPENNERQYSSQALEAAKLKMQELQQQRKIQGEYLEKTRVGLRHMEAHRDHPDLTCPKCSHKFSAQYEEKRYASLQADEQERGRLIEQVIGPELQRLEAYVQRCNEYAVSYRQYVQLTGNAQLLAPYWSLWSQQELLRTNPRGGVQALEAVHADLQKHVEVETLTGQLNERLELRQALQSIGSADLQTLIKTNQDIEDKLQGLTTTLQKATGLKLGYQRQQAQLRQYLELRGKIQAVIAQKRSLNKETQETIRRQELNGFIRTLQSSLAQIEAQIGSASQQKLIVDNLSKRIDEYVTQEEAAAIFVKEMSPTEGLIAEGLLGFIKNYVEQMNSIIASIWAYPLEVQSCEAVDSETVDLDYQFPVKVHNQGSMRKDVSDGSSGMVEIINLAFRMVAMQYHKLQDSPLYMDEFGSTLDSAHKAESVNLIKRLLEQKTFPQVFLVSHDFMQYGALANCQICLLNNLNVAAPAGNAVNQHVTMR